jgi:4'-phosphopantetheinyl transferase
MHISDPDFQPADKLRLTVDEVHLWRVDLEAVAGAETRWQQLLSSDEQARAARFHFDRDRQTYTATRAWLRTILARYLGSKPTDLVFRYSDKDKPSLALPGNRLEFNVSHSGSRALLAFARGRLVGVDVEHIREDFDPQALAHRFFSADEQRALATLDPEDHYAGFFRCWTRKEAYIKAIGTGLSLPLNQFDVSLRPGEENALLATRPDAGEAAVWSLREVSAGDGYAAALCVHGHGWRVRA